MRGDLRAVTVRALPRFPRPSFSGRITSLRVRREQRRRERLELIERLDHIERSSRRAGEHRPDLATIRRWC